MRWFLQAVTSHMDFWSKGVRIYVTVNFSVPIFEESRMLSYAQKRDSTVLDGILYLQQPNADYSLLLFLWVP